MNYLKDRIQSLLKAGYKVVGTGPTETTVQEYSGKVSNEQLFSIIFECEGKPREFVGIPQEYQEDILNYIKAL